MLKNYIKIALRNIQRQKGHAFINIMGLIVGIACCLLITLWILDELSYDRFHEDVDQIYQVLTHGSIQNNTSTPIPFVPVFKEAYPEILHASRYESFDSALLGHGDISFYENGIRVVDPGFFSIFTFPFLKGDSEEALKNPYSMVISQTMAEKYFPGEDALGKTLTMNGERDFTVTGVMKDIPLNSTIRFDIVIPYEIRILDAPARGGDPNSWGWWSPRAYIKVEKNISVSEFNEKIADFIQQHDENEDATVSLLPFTERYFFFWDTRKYITIYSVIAMFILIVACINFMNLSTARSANRADEIGIRKVAGAYRRHIIMQFFGESFMMTLIAFFAALLLVSILLSPFNAMTGKMLSVHTLGNPTPITVLCGLFLFTGLVSGSYPALFLSSFKPVRVLKGELTAGSSGILFRRILVIIQFTISIFLIIGTGIVNKQLDYLRTSDMGYPKEGLITVSFEGNSISFYEALKNRLLSDDRILGVTSMGDDLPYFGWGTSTAKWEGMDPNENILLNLNTIGYDFIETLGIKVVDGRSLSKEFPTDAKSGVIVNEELAKLMGSGSAVGKKMTIWDKTRTVVGVIQNCHFQPLMNRITPFFFVIDREHAYNMVVRMRSANIPAALEFIEETWEEIVPVYPFRYGFIDQRVNDSYLNIERIGNLSNGFTFIAMFIACLGLFGLASFTAEKRSKEIGIRKVLGSSMSKIVILLSSEFARCVLIANVIAWPVAYFAAKQWLQGFAYRISVGVDVFLFSAFLAFIIALLTVSYQAVKAARANPVDSLRYE